MLTDSEDGSHQNTEQCYPANVSSNVHAMQESDRSGSQVGTSMLTKFDSKNSKCGSTSPMIPGLKQAQSFFKTADGDEMGKQDEKELHFHGNLDVLA